MPDVSFNYIAIFIATVTSFALGGVFAAVFKSQLATLNGATDVEAQAKHHD